MRNLTKVIDQIMRELPNDHPLGASLANLKDSISYSAPEQMGFWWQEFALIINQDFTYPPKEDYEKKIYKIVTKKSFDEERDRVEAKQW